MESILKAIKKKKIPINPAVVISNKPNAKGLAIAKKMGIQTEVIESSKYKGKRFQYDKEIILTLKKYKVTPSNGLVCLAGFMRIISPYLVHFVDEGVDTGPIIIQEIVKINNNDTEKSLSKKILVKEHEIYPKAVELFAKKKISIKGRKVKISS